MSDYSTSLKYYSFQLNNLGMEIQNLLNNPLSLQNISMKLCEFGMKISNIGTQIFNIGAQINNNFSNPNTFIQLNNIKMPNDIMNNFDLNKINYNFDNGITIFFSEAITGKTTINTNKDITVEELLNLYALKKGIKLDDLKTYFFIINGKIININEKRTLRDYSFRNQDVIEVCKKSNVIGGP